VQCMVLDASAPIDRDPSAAYADEWRLPSAALASAPRRRRMKDDPVALRDLGGRSSARLREQTLALVDERQAVMVDAWANR
jgi:hypothetical protein